MISVAADDVKRLREKHGCSLYEAKLMAEKVRLKDIASGACQYENMSALYEVIEHLIERMK